MGRLKETDDFGNRMKAYEAVETARKLDSTLPIYARIDGRSFSRFTNGMDRPFDARMTMAMIETTKHLVHETNARIGYTQSDEISLVWLSDSSESDVVFSGKIQKMTSVLASMAASKFARVCPPGYEDRMPHFDCRVFQLPSKDEAANAFLWRAMDARKNAISMVAQSKFSHKKLHGMDQKAMLAMLKDVGVDFEAFPEAFRLGSFVRRYTVERDLTDEELERIPEKHRPIGPVTRNEIRVIDMPPFNKVSNRVEVIFARPMTQPIQDTTAVPRCPICDWPLAKNRKEGCVPGDCSYRPDDPVEQERIRLRRYPSLAPPSSKAGEAIWHEAMETAAKIAEKGCLVPPDGGSPTEEEREMCESIASAIRVKKLFPPARALSRSEAPVVSVKRMAISAGRADYFVSIKVGDREITPFKLREDWQAQYEAESFRWLLLGAPKPERRAYGPEGWPGSSAPPSQPDTTVREALTSTERLLLEWLQKDDGQYGECHGATLDGLIVKGFAKVNGAETGLDNSFIAKGADIMFRSVSITDAGRAALPPDAGDRG